MQPLIARNLLEQIHLLTNSARVFSERVLGGLEPDRSRIAALVGQSLSLATALAPALGYERASQIAKRASDEGKTVHEVAIEESVLPEDELNRVLDPRRQTEPGW